MNGIRWLVRVFPITLAVMILLGVGFIAVARIQNSVEAQGEVHVERYQVVRPQVAGLVTEVRAEPGDWVRTGQVLLQLQDYQLQKDLLTARMSLDETRSRLQKLRTEQHLQLEILHPLKIERQRSEIGRSLLEKRLAASQVKEAELELEAARERLRQAEELTDEGLISERELQEHRQRALAAEQRHIQAGITERTVAMQTPTLETELELLTGEQNRELATLEAEIEGLETELAEWTGQVEQLEVLQELQTLRAQMDGVLVGSPVLDLLGQYVQAGQELMTIIDTASIQFVTLVPEQALVQVRAGQPAQVEIAGLPKNQFRLFTGRVAKVLQEPRLESPSLTARQNPLYPVQIRLEEPWIPLDEDRFYLRGGMRGTAKIAYRRDVPLIRALYEFLVGKPQLPEPALPEEPSVTADRGLTNRGLGAEPPSSSPALARSTM